MSAFDSHDYYSTNEDEEHLTCTTPEDALEEWCDWYSEEDMSALGKLTVYAWRRRMIPAGTIDWAVRIAVGYIDEAIGEEYGDRDGGEFFDGASADILTTGVRAAINAALERADVYWCERVDSREYSGDEVREMLREEATP